MESLVKQINLRVKTEFWNDNASGEGILHLRTESGTETRSRI